METDRSLWFSASSLSCSWPSMWPITLRDPSSGFTFPIPGAVDHHYVVAPVLIHDDPFIVVLDVRNGKVATHMVFEPYEPFRD